MTPALQTIIDEARSRMRCQPQAAAILIEARSDELEYMHMRAGNGHHWTLQSMARAGITSFDLLEAITELRAIARGEASTHQIAAE